MKQSLIKVKNSVLILKLKRLLNMLVKGGNTSKRAKVYVSANPQKGFTLIEVIVTLFLVAVALLGIMLVQKTIIDGAIDNSQRSIGVFKSSEAIDRMRANGEGIQFYQIYMNSFTPNTCFTTKGPDCSESCDPFQIAERDAYDVFCGSGTKGGDVNQQFINLQSMKLDCDGVCELGKAANLTLVWNVTGANPDSDGVPQNTNVETNSISLDVLL